MTRFVETGAPTVEALRMPSRDCTRGGWVCLFTQPRREQMAVGSLQEANFEVYLPIYRKLVLRNGKLVVMRTPLFPRYLFIKGATSGNDVYAASHLPGITSFAGRTLEQSCVADGIIQCLKAKHDDEGLIIFDPTAVRRGENVRVLNGAFGGFQAVFDEPDDRVRSYILLNLLGKTHRVSVSNRDLEVTA